MSEKSAATTSNQPNEKKRLVILSGILLIAGLVLGNGVLSAQTPPHDGLASCQSYANKWYMQENPDSFESVTLSREDLDEEKYEANVGKQFVSTVLSGFGQSKYKGEKPSPIQFTCLLESDQKAVFFHASESKAPDPVKQCWNRFQPGEWGSMQTCLNNALSQAETTLSTLETEAKTQAQKVEKQWHQSSANNALNTSTTDWKTYRDAECARRAAFRTGGNHPDVSRTECLIRKTEERIQDFHFEE